MWAQHDIVRAGSAVIVTLTGWAFIRLAFPTLDYYPPELLVRELGQSWFSIEGMRRPVKVGYAMIALVLMACFFKVIQQRWPGRAAVKGVIFGIWLGGVWSFGFLTGWAFLGTTLCAEILNSVVDIIPLMIAGCLIGIAIGRDVPKPEHRTTRPWLAVLPIALVFVAVHTLGATLFANIVGPASRILLLPTSPLQFILLTGLGIWIAGMYLLLRAKLPFERASTRAAFFAFGIFGYWWTWFHLFFVIEIAGVMPAALLVGLTGAVGVFAGILVYEWLSAGHPDESS